MATARMVAATRLIACIKAASAGPRLGLVVAGWRTAVAVIAAVVALLEASVVVLARGPPIVVAGAPVELSGSGGASSVKLRIVPALLIAAAPATHGTADAILGSLLLGPAIIESSLLELAVIVAPLVAEASAAIEGPAPSVAVSRRRKIWLAIAWEPPSTDTDSTAIAIVARRLVVAASCAGGNGNHLGRVIASRTWGKVAQRSATDWGSAG